MIRIRARAPGRRALAPGLPTARGAAAVAGEPACPLARQCGLRVRIVSGAVLFAVGTGLVLHARRTLREPKRSREAAAAARGALPRPLPPRVGGLRVAAAQLSADRRAGVGGDLYEVVATEYGVRAVIGDVRGHGVGAVGTVAAVLGGFREAVHDEPDLGRVLRRLDRALARDLRERARTAGPDSPVAEDFVTLLLLEIAPGGEVQALNCGHPWPYRLLGARVEPLSRADPLPPLGPFPLPPELPAVRCAALRPGEALFLHTDGAEEARDAQGRFFPLTAVLTEALGAGAGTPRALLAAVFTRLLRHTAGQPADDVALLVLHDARRPRPAAAAAPGTTRAATP
ncbi:PP2C family protein-serine/threonine phosphatase [Streptomyces glaucescens]|uniref:Magnesium or manganese-dependent protein phosphatase n=1 Tax=Streptomyces glaucescens TaxID=1907 RepID=A0A089YUM1_STRGA|nr:PP2C family protein-serine/threonine phosphatase [Streptomyces glaucescens]AIR97330.1 magnesium or manganese-dependent protein phosphatase [Streptomyces glaucescens]